MSDGPMPGTPLGDVRFPVERSKMAELAKALHDGDPAWWDAAAAEAAGLDDVPMPPTMSAIADHSRPDGALSHALALGLDVERLLHGEAAWEYLAPVRVGDELTARSHVGEVSQREGRRGGAMTLVTVRTDFTNQRGELVMRRRDTLIEAGA